MDRATALRLFETMLLTRLAEERLVKLFRQGQTMGSVYRSLGQEATAVASAMALEPGDAIGPMIRNLGSMFARGVTPEEIFRQYTGRGTSPTGGREHNNHFGDPARGIVAPTSMLGALVPVMAGVAYAFKLQGKANAAMTWIGDGGSSTGAFSEGLNFAAVHRLPLIVVGEANGYAYSTPTGKQMTGSLSERGQGAYTLTVDGNDAVAVHQAAAFSRQQCLMGLGPVFLVCETFRMGGHAEHDDQRYVDPQVKAMWAAKDPLPRFNTWLAQQGWAPDPGLASHLEAMLAKVADAVLAEPPPDPALLGTGIYAS